MLSLCLREYVQVIQNRELSSIYNVREREKVTRMDKLNDVELNNFVKPKQGDREWCDT